MADKSGKGLPDVKEPPVGPEGLVYEKAVGGFDWKVFLTLIGSGIICGVCMWIAFSFVGGSIDLEALSGAIVGGVVSGAAIYALTG